MRAHTTYLNLHCLCLVCLSYVLVSYLSDPDPTVLPTDSRRRLDSRFLKAEETNKATAWKRVAENKQRADEKERNEAWSKTSGKSKPESDIEVRLILKTAVDFL